MAWNYVAVRDEDTGLYWLHEQFGGGFGHTEQPVTIGADSVSELARWLRQAADDVEKHEAIEGDEG